MSIPTTLESLSTTAASNGPAGSEQRTLADDGLRQSYAFLKQLVSLATLASASTVTPPSTAKVFSVTGTTTINTIASTNSWDGREITLIFAGALILTHSSNLALPGSANITTVANDIAIFVQTASGAWRCENYMRASGALIGTTGVDLTLSGNLTVQGNTAIGNAGADTLSIASSAVTWSGSPVHSGAHTWNAASAAAALTTYQIAAVTKGYIGNDGGGILGTGTGTGFGVRSEADLLLLAGAGTYNLRYSSTGNATFSTPSAGTTVTAPAVAAGVSYASSAPAAYTVLSFSDGTRIGSLSTNASFGALFGTTSAHDVSILVNNAVGLVVTSDKRVYGTALHNNAGAVTGTTNQYVASGTYTPTLTNTTNIAASSFTNSPPAKWKRVGNEVTVTGHVTIQATAAAGAQCTLDLTLPIASNLANFEDCSGTASDAGGVGAANQNSSGLIQANVVNDRAQIIFRANNTSSQIWGFTFMYTVL